MRTTSRATLLLMISASAAMGCAEFAPSDSATPATADDTPWLTRYRSIDFTGDGIEDTVRLEAVGRDVDSIRIALTFVSGGEVRWGVEWASPYELTIPAPPEDPAARAEHLRRRLGRVIASVQLEPFDRTAYLTMAQEVDSTLLASPPARQVTFSYGYETTVVLAWDPVAERLRVLHSCC
ncbi:MAG TPA: hypothetical protein VF037_11825 [Gemmatimonadales bacterium]